MRGEREQETQMEGAVGAHFAPPRQGTHIDLESLSSVRASSMVWTSFLFHGPPPLLFLAGLLLLSVLTKKNPGVRLLKNWECLLPETE